MPDHAERVEGSTYKTTSQKDREGERLTGQEAKGDGRLVPQTKPAGTIPVSVRLGRTVGLKQFEFGRVTIAFSMYVLPEDADEGYDVCEAIARELVDREVAVLSNESREDVEMEANLPDGRGHARELTIEYGLTLSLRKYESAKVDIGRTAPLADDDDLEAKAQEVRTWLEERISAQARRIKGVPDTTDKGL